MKARILLVEDENIVAMELESVLRGLGYAIAATASSGEAAIDRAEETRPDLVLMDIRLKGNVDGIEAAEQIRTLFGTPVIYLTAYAEKATLERAKVTEPYGYLIKPFEERELHTSIEMALYRHRMERELRERERWLSAVLGSIGDAVITTDSSGFITFMNPVAGSLINQRDKDVLGTKLPDVLNLVDQRTHLFLESPVDKAVQGDGVPGLGSSTLLCVDNGREVPIEGSATPIRDDKGQVTGAVLILRDVTARRQMELALVHNERLAAMGQLAASLAHEIRNPLQSITSSVQLVLHYPVDEEKKAESLRIADRELQRLGRIIRQMLNFSKPPSAEYQPIHVADVIRYALSLTGKQLQHSGIRADVSVADSLPTVLGSPDQIVQVLLNLILNAEEAMPSGGQLSVSARLVDQRIELTVTDDGPGFAPEAVSRLFQPFHTTKEEGTGLGLSVSHSIIQQHGGTISASNVPGRGAAVTIMLPLAPPQGSLVEEQK